MLDPITLTVLHHRLQQITEEMDVILDRAAFSPIISEGQDRASGIFDPVDGKLVAQGATGMPIHIGAMQYAAATIARRRGGHAPGDIYIINDPYKGGTHLMDVKLIMPVFVEGRLFCLLGSSGHWPDIGGAVPGGFVTRAVEVQQEGIRIGGQRICRGGEIEQDLLDLILDNVRVPEQRVGDLKAQIASLRAGEAQIARLLSEHSLDVVEKAIAALRKTSADLMAERIATLKPGRYSFEDALDNDGVEDNPLWIRLDLTVEPNRLVFDFSRSSPPCRGPMNSVISTTASAVFVALKHIYPEIPMNGGCFDPVEVIAPETTFLNVGYPRPVSGCAAEVSQRVVDVVFGAMAQAAPGELTGAPFGSAINVTIGGFDPGQKKRYVFYFYSGGGAGGYQGGDGLSNACSTVGLAKTPPLEVVEQQTPILFERYALREGSAGSGQFRGGLGVEYKLKLMRGEARLSVLGDRAKFQPYGIEGGLPAAGTSIDMEISGASYTPPMLAKDEGIVISSGDTFTCRTPGGGGFGDPARRDPQRVARDLANGFTAGDGGNKF
ncbi:hydantoinase B/oxoprolinase family protein [Pseudaminobacter salicylatoxidans]|uniref:hydantoinase B/oxoprolinase family protein n=1 Tax=Pseudaminobacter salicylatoxidans TaxID=93369 RepID=UPI0002E7C0A5|nr:hydantoinase B/oxoprolinase family protein [Pseudaminobacter salicylatoxidans]